MNTQKIAQEEIWGQLDKMLASKDFLATARQTKFLRYIIQATLDYNYEALKAQAIAMEVFEQGKGFDSRNNPLVRSEMARLRSKFERYYSAHPDDEIKIDIPKGRYIATFAKTNAAAVEAASFSEDGAPGGQMSQSPDYNRTILILPFDSTGDIGVAEQLISGLLKEVSGNLTKFYDLEVIEHNFSRQYTSESSGLDAKRLEKEYSNARFLLGSRVQLTEDFFKIWMTLRDAKTDFNVWSEKYEGNLGEKPDFKWQEEISEAIVLNIAGEFGAITKARVREYLTIAEDTPLAEKAFLLYTQWTLSLTDEALGKALEVAEKAAETYPENSVLQAVLADLYYGCYEYGRPNTEDCLDKSYQILIRTINQDPGCQLAHLVMSFHHFGRNDVDNFLASAKKAIEINPSSANAQISLSSLYAMLNMWDIAMNYVEKIKSLNLSYPNWGYAIYALYYYFHKNYEAAYTQALRIIPSQTLWNPLVRLLSSGMLGNKTQAELALRDLLKSYPNFLDNGRMILRRLSPDDANYKALCEGLSKAEKLLDIACTKQARA